MTKVAKIRITIVVASVILAAIWLIVSKSEKGKGSGIPADYEFKPWVGTKDEWLNNKNDANTLVISATERIEVIRAKRPDETKAHLEEFKPREKPRTQKFYIISENDTLSAISKRYYGTSRNWRKIFEANRDVINDPDFLPKGVKITIPE